MNITTQKIFTNDPKSLKYVAYLRKSTEEDDRQAMSIEDQKENIEAWFKGYDITFITDEEGKLGESMSAAKPGRPLFNQMLADVESGKYQGIIAWHPDRLSRNAPDAARIIWDIQQGYIQNLMFCNFTFEPTPEGIMMLQMIMSQAQYYSAKLSKDVRRGNAKKRRSGGITTPAPLGYLNNTLTKQIEIDPLRFPLLQKAFRLFLTGAYSVNEIAHMTRDWGLTLKESKNRPTRPIRAQNLYYIFRSKFYAGKIVDPYTKEEFQGKHQPMITPEEYDRAQEIIAQHGKPKDTPKKDCFPLRGFIRCGECGCMITAEQKEKHQKNGNVHKYTYYHCTHKSKVHKCTQGSIQEEALQQQLDALLEQYELSPELYELGAKALQEIASIELKERDSIQANQTKAISTVQNQLDRLLDLVTSNVISPEDYTKKSAILRQELNNLQQKQKETNERSKNWYEIVGTTLAQLAGAGDKFKNGSLDDKRQLLTALGSNPILTDGRLSLQEYYWLSPIKENKTVLTDTFKKVRTYQQQIKNSPSGATYSVWLPGLDSNQ